MTTQEKVRLAVSHCLRSNDCYRCEACPYNEGTDYGCRARLRDDIIELLKVQEPVQPQKLMAKNKNGYRCRFYCGKCGDEIDRLDKYCRHCGRAVKWE